MVSESAISDVRFSSKAAISGMSNLFASSTQSLLLVAQTLAIKLGYWEANCGRFSLRNCSMPGFGIPLLKIIPPTASAVRGGTFPSLGFTETDGVMKVMRFEGSTISEASNPNPHVPEAFRSGEGIRRLVQRSKDKSIA